MFVKYSLMTLKILFNLIKAFFLLLCIVFTIADILVVEENLGIKIFIALVFSTAILLSWFLPKKFKKTRLVLDIMIAVFLLLRYPLTISAPSKIHCSTADLMNTGFLPNFR